MSQPSKPARRATMESSPNVYDDMKQGVKVLHPLKEEEAKEKKIDIVLVPGLGANPEKCWEWEKTKFSWPVHPKGLVSDCPNARILLHMYESAWIGPRKVNQSISNAANSLLQGLKAHSAEDAPRRPIVFIGHSMGGLVIAKAVTMMETQGVWSRNMLEAVAGAVFFGTPFRGANASVWGNIFCKLRDGSGGDYKTQLLGLMDPHSGELHDLRSDFIRLAARLQPPIPLGCIWEQHPTNAAQFVGLADPYGLVKSLAPRCADLQLVTQHSATLDNRQWEFGLARDHRGLNKFEGPKDMSWQSVRNPLREMVNNAPSMVRKRLQAIRDIDHELIGSITDTLETAPVRKKRDALLKSFKPSSWIPEEQEFVDWLDRSWVRQPGPEAAGRDPRGDVRPAGGGFMWIRGPQGRGKTGATLAAIAEIEKLKKRLQGADDQVLMAYYFCNEKDECSTAEDLLKSIIMQLIQQQRALAVYAKQFIENKDHPKPAAQATVENLWRALDDMLWDELVWSRTRVYFVLNNLHALPWPSESTEKLLRYIKAALGPGVEARPGVEADDDGGDRRQLSTRWLITSRGNVERVEEALDVAGRQLVNLEDARYEGQVRRELRMYAKTGLQTLASRKGYSPALRYLAGGLIGGRARSTQWIDVMYLLLEELPQGDDDAHVRSRLESMPQELQALLTHSWQSFFLFRPGDGGGGGGGGLVHQMKEMLRTLVLTYDDPTEPELAVLAGFASSRERRAELRALVDRCRPLLRTREVRVLGHGGAAPATHTVVAFASAVVKEHLLEHSKELLGLDGEERKFQHGVIAHRCFADLCERFDVGPETAAGGDDGASAETGGEGGRCEEGRCEESDGEESDGEESDEESDDQESDDGESRHEESQHEESQHEESQHEESQHEESHDEESHQAESRRAVSHHAEPHREDLHPYVDDDMGPDDAPIEGVKTSYPVKYWLRHASEATLEVAQDLTQEEDFWQPDSRIRRRWLDEYAETESTFDNLDHRSMTSLHIACSIGFRGLVEALIQAGHRDQVNVHDSLDNTPLHLVAFFDQVDIIDALLRSGARVNDQGRGGREETPLHMAAHRGRLGTISKLIRERADPNAVAERTGPVINAAICSGVREAVDLLIDRGASLSVVPAPGDAWYSPVGLAALHWDLPMFDALIQRSSDKIPPGQYSMALVQAAYGGRNDVFGRLLDFRHGQRDYQDALAAAAGEENWEIAKKILATCPGLSCDVLFRAAARCAEPQVAVLDAAWRYGERAISAETVACALFDAADMEQESAVRFLLDACGADANALGEEFGNALTIAAFNGSETIVRMLLDAGADVNSPDGWALQEAAIEGHLAVVELLLERGAAVNARTLSPECAAGTALQGACEAAEVAIVDLLLARGADPDLGFGPESPPVVAAALRGADDILQRLVAARAAVDVFDGDGETTLLNRATAILPVDSLRLLLDAGASVDLADGEGNTPLIVAASIDDDAAVELFLDRGADLLRVNAEGRNALQTALDEGSDDSLRILVDRVSGLLAALRASRDAGCAEVARLVRGAVGPSPDRGGGAGEDGEGGEDGEDGEDGEEQRRPTEPPSGAPRAASPPPEPARPPGDGQHRRTGGSAPEGGLDAGAPPTVTASLYEPWLDQPPAPVADAYKTRNHEAQQKGGPATQYGPLDQEAQQKGGADTRFDASRQASDAECRHQGPDPLQGAGLSPPASKPSDEARMPPASKPSDDARTPSAPKPPYEARTSPAPNPPDEARKPPAPNPPGEARTSSASRPPHEARTPSASKPLYETRTPPAPNTPDEARPPPASKPPGEARPSPAPNPPHEARPPPRLLPRRPLPGQDAARLQGQQPRPPSHSTPDLLHGAAAAHQGGAPDNGLPSPEPRPGQAGDGHAPSHDGGAQDGGPGDGSSGRRQKRPPLFGIGRAALNEMLDKTLDRAALLDKRALDKAVERGRAMLNRR